MPHKTTRDALKRLSDLFDFGQGDEPAAPADEPDGNESGGGQDEAE